MAVSLGIAWYTGPLKVELTQELEDYPDIVTRLGWFKSRFLSWCSKQRIIYEHDIYDEIAEFEAKFIKHRLYNTDIKLWRKLSVQIFERDNFTCQYCAQKGGILEIDHIIPLSRGGTNKKTNLTTACRRCNRQKKDKTPEEFISWRLTNNAQN